MRTMARWMLLGFVFTIPWAYSLDLGVPWGNIARIFGLLTLAAAAPAILETRCLQRVGAIPMLVLAFFLYLCCTILWTVSPEATAIELRGIFQKTMVVWLVWELAASPRDLRLLLRAGVAGMAVLAALTVADMRSAQALVEGRLRYAANGQDPNDVAHVLALGLPLAALLAVSERRHVGRWLALGYFPLALGAILLTASRGGFLAAVTALLVSGLLFYRHAPRQTLAVALLLPVILGFFWFEVPSASLARLASIPEQLQGGGLNLRWQIWNAGWEAFGRAPLFGSGAGTFVHAAATVQADTAHNTALSIAVNSGLCGLLLAAAITVAALLALRRIPGELRMAFAASLLVCALSSLVSTVDESRPAWLLLAWIALAERLARETPQELAYCFASAVPRSLPAQNVPQRKTMPQ